MRSTAEDLLGGVPNIRLIAPLDAVDMHRLMARSYMVMTDSGGIQEEAPALGKPVLVLRRETERPEAVTAGTVKLAGTDTEEIYRLAAELLDDPAANAACLFAKRKALSRTQEMLRELRNVERREVEKCIREVLGRIFEVGLTGFVITCPEERQEEIVEEFSEIGFEVEVKAFDSLLLESFSCLCWNHSCAEGAYWNGNDGILSGVSTAITQEDVRSAERSRWTGPLF